MPKSPDADVITTAHQFGVDPHLIQAVVDSEGDIVKAVRCSVPSVTGRPQALEITCRSAAHALSDYVKTTHAADFVHFWQQRWAPVGASNDPTHLNANWARNVLALWHTP